MRHVLFVVEGAHDATFLGLLLSQEGFRLIRRRSEVPEAWRELIPQVFPSGENRDRLAHVVDYPDMYLRHVGEPMAVGVVSAGGRPRLVRELRKALDALQSSTLHAVAVFSDADTEPAASAMTQILGEIGNMNAASVRAKNPGYPIAFPSEPGFVLDGAPRTGIYIFPDCEAPGTLESVLLRCAALSYRDLLALADRFVGAVDEALPVGHADLARMRAGAGKEKAIVSSIGSVTHPGDNVVVAIRDGRWLDGAGRDTEHVAKLRAFLKAMLD